jgi:UDP-glucose 4-epimerase
VLDNLSTGFHRLGGRRRRAALRRRDRRPDIGRRIIRDHGIDAIIHFAASIVVPDSVRDPLGLLPQQHVNSRALIECAVRCGVRHFIFSSTAAVYGNPGETP